MLSPTLQFPQNAMVSTVRLEPWETSLAAFLRVRWSGDVDSQRRQAQEFVDKLDVVRDYARPLGYSRFTDHVFRLSITGVFTDKNENSIRGLYGSCVEAFAFSHPRSHSHQSPSSAKPGHLHQVASQESTKERSKVSLSQSKPSRLTAQQIARSCPR